jgi:aminocarboxymuconate-semialdehyde decarboxylase
MVTSPVIDFHGHVIHPDVYARTVNHNVVSGFGARPLEQRPGPDSARWAIFSKMIRAEIQLAQMDELGIARRVISTSTVSQSTFFADPGAAAAMDRQANEGIADWVRAYRGRFIGSFTLPLQDMPRALAELGYAVKNLGLRIANLPAAHHGRYLGDPYFLPLWEAIVDNGVAALVHPDGIKDADFQQFSLWNAIGQGIEETRVMASLIYEGIFERFPDLQIVISHAGGYLPLYIARLDRNATAHPASMKNLRRKPSEYLRNFYFDTVTYDPLIVRILAERVGADRLLFGSDYPFGDDDPMQLVHRCGFDQPTTAAVAGGNAEALLQRSGVASSLELQS